MEYGLPKISWKAVSASGRLAIWDYYLIVCVYVSRVWNDVCGNDCDSLQI